VDSAEINRAWDNIRENITISAQESLCCCESRHHKPRFDEDCSKLVDRRKQAKLQWLQHPSEVNEGNLSDVRGEASRHFTDKKREYLKDKINKLESSSKNKNIRDLYRVINEFEKGHQPRNNLVKDEKSNLSADPHKILNRWKNYFYQLFNVHGASVLRQNDMHTSDLFVPKSSPSDVDVTIGKLKSKISMCWSDLD
jgi:hypothetical protein